VVGPSGFAMLPATPARLAWVAAALPAARAALAAGTDWRSGGTWFPGVDALPSDAAGRIAGGPAPAGLPATPRPLHPAQLSVTRPGYPRPGAGEGAAAFSYRLRRDAAHLDGLLPVGPDRRRFLREPHAWIAGIALTPADPGAAPLVVWEGSQQVMRAALAQALAGHAPADWAGVDLTEPYKAARRAVFASCPRREIPLEPGQMVLLHRLLLHGIAPWAEGAQAAPEGRMIAYYRPCLTDPADWLAAG